MKNNKSEVIQSDYGNAANGDFNNLESIESVYSNDTIDLVDVQDVLNAHQIDKQQPEFDFNQSAANEHVVEAGIYSLSGARRAKLDKSIERRASKSRLTDRRQSLRMDANGNPELDRRADNRLINIESLRQEH